MKIVKVNLPQNPYNISLGFGLFKNISNHIKRLNIGNFAVIVTSKKVYSLYKSQIQKSFNNLSSTIVVVPDGEGAKTKECLFKIIDGLVKADKLGRKIFLVCLGGGTVGDVGGFAASMYKRGIPYVQIPTTLLSQIDASIGGKTAIDLKEAKNILGAFYQPKAVFIDPVFLSTLAKPELNEGLAEAVKYAVIKDKKLFCFLEKNYKQVLSLNPSAILKVIDTCVKIKAKIVSQDEKEKKGIRTILNFGHTFGHGIEAASGYKQVSHGQAVSAGMVYSAYLSCRLNYASCSEMGKIMSLLKKLGLPVRINFVPSKVYTAMSYDKKIISGNFRFVILHNIGKVSVVENISRKLVYDALKKINTLV